MKIYQPVDALDELSGPNTPEMTAAAQPSQMKRQSTSAFPMQTNDALRREVDRLTDELDEANRKLAQKNRLANLGQITAHMAHEIRNNLVPVTLYLNLLRRRLSGSENVDVVRKAESGLSSLEATVNDLLNFTSDRDPFWQTFSMRAVVDDVLQSVRARLEAQQIDVDIDVPRMLCVRADYNMLRRAVMNLTLNAMDAMPDGGDMVITGCQGLKGMELEIADSGPGLGDDARRRAFQPFFSTKTGGSGLGLAIVHRIAEVHGGSVQCANCAEGGAAFTMQFPHSPALEAAA